MTRTSDSLQAVEENLRFAALHPRAVLSLAGETLAEWYAAKAPRLGASLAFYTVLSMAPLLLVVVAVAGLVFGEQAARGQIFWQVRDWIGPEAALAIEAVLQNAHRPGAGALASILGLLTLFFGATAVVGELRDALNTIWGAQEAPGAFGLRAVVDLLVSRFLSFVMVLGVGFLLLVSLVVNASVAAAGAYFTSYLPVGEPVLQLLNFAASFVVTAILFALLYRILPDVRIAWADLAVGAVVTSFLFTTGKLLIGMYLGKSGVTSPYGAAGSMVLVLLWVYYSAQVFFLGAQFTKVFANRFGSRLRTRSLTN